MEILTPGVASKEEISKIKESVHKINEARMEWNRQCLINVMFLYGKQHFSMSRASHGVQSVGQSLVWELEKANANRAIRRTCNYILPLFRSLYSRLIRQKANVHAQPTTSMQSDRDAARVSKEILEDFWQNCNRNNPWLRDEYSGMQSILMKLILYKMTIGMGELIPYFNPKAETMLFDQSSNQSFRASVGEAEVRVVMPINMFRDRFNRFAIERRFISPEQVAYEFDVDVSPSEVDEEDYGVRVRRALDGSDSEKLDKDGVYLYHKYCVPTKEYPNGKVMVCTDDKIVFDGDLPSESRGRIPAFQFRYQDLGFSQSSQGCIEQVIDPQQDLNFTVSRIAQHKKLLTGKILVPKGAELNIKHDDSVGQIIQYALGRKPTMEPAPSVPAYFYEEIKRIRETMEALMNSHDVSMGRTPGQVNSGVGISNLSEMDNAQIAPELIIFEQKLGFFGEYVLDIIQEKYNERRLLSISGENMGIEVKSFIGSDILGQKNIVIKMGSNFPLDKTERTNYILMLKNEGFISPERAKELLEFTDVDGAFKSLDEQGAKQDILNIIENRGEVGAEPFEDHTIHLKVINDFRKGSSYQNLDMSLRQRIDALAEEHQQYLLAEQQAAAGMGAPLPPSAQPQMNGASK